MNQMYVSAQMISSEDEVPITLMMVSSHSLSFQVVFGYPHVECTLCSDIPMFLASRTKSFQPVSSCCIVSFPFNDVHVWPKDQTNYAN